MAEPTLEVIATITAAAVLLLAVTVGITTQKGIRLVIIAIMISLIPEASRSISWLRSGEIGRRRNERRRAGKPQPCIDSPKVDR